MAFKLTLDERIAAGLRRVALEQLDGCLADLNGLGERAVDEIVHETRRRLKRVRAVLRLLRRTLGRDACRRDDDCLRQAANRLSPARDAAVLLQTLDWLALQAGAGDEAATACRAAKAWLVEHGRPAAVAPPAGDELTRLASLLAAVRQRVAAWPAGGGSWAPIGFGLRRCYGKCRRLAGIAERSNQADCFHQWRKQAKRLWHQLQLLRPCWPEVLEPLCDELARLSTALGQHHDLSLLIEALDRPAAGPPLPEIKHVVALAQASRQAVARQAIALGRRLLAERPARFEARLRTCWQAWHEFPPI